MDIERVKKDKKKKKKSRRNLEDHDNDERGVENDYSDNDMVANNSVSED